MMNQTEWMNSGSIRGIATFVLGGVCLFAFACSDSSDQAGNTQSSAATARQPYQPQPIAPQWSLADITMDQRVQFPEERLPASRDVAQAVADFASALVAGQTDRLRAMLTGRDQALVETLLKEGAWAGDAKGLPAVRVSVLEETGEGFRLGLSIQDDLGAYLTAWEGTGTGGAWVLSGIAIEPVLAERLTDLDGSGLIAPQLPQTVTAAAEAPAPEKDQPASAPSGGAPGGLQEDPF